MASIYNLKVLNNSGTPNTKIDIKGGPRGTTWQAILEDASSPPNTLKVISSSTLTINTAGTGANGIDTGSQASSTWYYIWVISDGTTTAAMVSTSSTSPTMPSGYVSTRAWLEQCTRMAPRIS